MPVALLARLLEEDVMSETKWTRGPWRVEEDTTLVWGDCSIDDDGTPIHLGVPVAEALGNPRWGRSDRITDVVRNANAHLISAAPALYDRLLASNIALTATLDRVGEGFADELRHEIAKNRRALSAARGEEG